MKFLGFGNVVYRTSDYEKSRAFYTDVVGLKEKFTIKDKNGADWLTYFEICKGRHLALYHFNQPLEDKLGGSFRHCCFITNDIDASSAKHESQGQTLWVGPYTSNEPWPVPFAASKRRGKCGSYDYSLADPDFNVVEIQVYNKTALQGMTKEEVDQVIEQVKNNTYVPEAETQGSERNP